MRIAGLVIAGGLATRMKADKPFVSFQSGFLLDAVIDRVKPQVDILMLNVRTEHIALCRFRYGDEFALVPDAFNGNAGPLGGVVARGCSAAILGRAVAGHISMRYAFYSATYRFNPTEGGTTSYRQACSSGRCGSGAELACLVALPMHGCPA